MESSTLPILQVGKFSLPVFVLVLSPLPIDLSINVQPPQSPPATDKMLCVTQRAHLLKNIRGCKASLMNTYRRFANLYKESLAADQYCSKLQQPQGK